MDPFKARRRRTQPEPAPEPVGTVVVETEQGSAATKVDGQLEPVEALPARSKLEAMRKADLQALARARGVPFAADDTKDELVDALEAAAGR